MKVMMLAAAIAMLGAGPALAQSYGSETGTTQGPPSDDRVDPSLRAEPPAGAYQGYFESRDLPQQTAEVPSEPEAAKPHPGTLKKFNSNSGYGPEVEFEVERREAQQKKMQR